MFSSTDSAKNALDVFPQTAQTRKRLWICSHKQKNSKDIQPIVSSHIETVVLLGRKRIDSYISTKLDVDKMKMKKNATYDDIKSYVKDKYGLSVSSLYIAQVKEKLGLEKGKNTNLGSGEGRVPKCPPEKEEAIKDD